MNIKEQIRAEIDKRYAEYREKMKTDDFTYYEGMADALDLFEQYIDSLQQEMWKPSEEQMDRLSSIIAALRKDYCDDMADFLASIYHNLKKLM